MKKRIMCWVLSITVFLSSVPAAYANTGAQTGDTYTYTYVNPAYENEVSSVDLQKLQQTGSIRLFSSDAETYETTIASAASKVRAAAKKRSTAITVYYQSASLPSGQLATDIWNSAMAHTGVPNEGDYLSMQYGGWSCNISLFESNGIYYSTLTYTVSYYTTAAQEERMNSEVAAVLSKLNLSGKSDYEKIKGIYDYICKNVTYDYAHQNDDSYYLKYTAYGALVNKTAICQGYPLLFCRLALELGVDARFIGGYGKGDTHAWAIVKLGGKYYNVDPTWDAIRLQDGLPYEYFLRCNASFSDHTRDVEYTTTSFNNAYPMAGSDFEGINPGQFASPTKVFFEYRGSPKDKEDNETVCWYSDSYFDENSYIYQPSLATMSLCLAMSAFASNEATYKNKSQNVIDLMKKIGISSSAIAINDWFKVKPLADSIGVAIGSKPIKSNGADYTLIAVAIRGGGYEQEWASNFTVGESGMHSGFDTAKKNVVSFLKQYLSNNDIHGKLKIWVTGYSRAAATANLVGGAIDDGALDSPDYSVARKDVFTYCFETPAGATLNVSKQTVYSNIFNIINPSDPVPFVAPSAWGFCRYGIDKYLPTAAIDPDYAKYNTANSLVGGHKYEMLKQYLTLPDIKEYTVDDFQMKAILITYNLITRLPGVKIADDNKNNMTQSMFLNSLVKQLAGLIGKRSDYIKQYEDSFRMIFICIEGITIKQAEMATSSFMKQVEKNWGSLVASMLLDKSETGRVIEDWFLTALKDAGLTVNNKQKLDEAVVRLTLLVVEMASLHLNMTTTLFYNLGRIGKAHYPELCYAWLAAMDPNYVSKPFLALFNGTYRIVRVNCEVDVNVFNENDDLVAAIKDDEPQVITGSSIISGIDQDGQKYVVLPIAEAYSVHIVAREDDNIDYGVDEYCPESGDYSRSINYIDISLKQGEQIIGQIPELKEEEQEESLIEGSTADYALTSPSFGSIVPDSNITGDNIDEAYYYIDVSTDNIQNGVVIGSGSRLAYSYAQVEAIPNEGFVFAGWFDNNKCVSEEQTYRFRVTKDVTLVAKFIPELGHTHSYLSVITNPSCTGSGFTTYTCSECGDSYIGNETAALGHDYKAIVTAPTCTSVGFTAYTCSRCDSSYIDNVIAALGHDWGVGVVTKEPTETAKGERSNTCSRCGEKRTEEIPELSHVHSYIAMVTAPTCTEKGYTTYTCTCGESYFDNETAALGHSFGVWITTKASTCTDAGEETRTCSRCGEKEYRATTATGHDFMAEVTEPTCMAAGFITYTCSKCGDSYTGDEVAMLGHDYKDGVCTRCGGADPDYLPPIDRAALQAAIAIAEKIDRSKYTDETVAAMEAALTAAKAALEAEKPADVNDAAATLDAAVKALKEKSVLRFDDVKDPAQYYYEPVYWAVDKSITTGTGAATFSPNAGCTRAQVVTFLWRAAGEPEPTKGDNPFQDVKPNAYYYKAVLWAVEKGITTGTSATTFRPDATCTRGQIVTFLWRYNDMPEPTKTDNPFADVKADQYYYKAVLWAVEKDITKGTSDTKFCPDSTCTRGQIVTFLYRDKK